VIVIDASAALELLLGTRAGYLVMERTLGRHETLHAPQLLDLEVVQVLRRYVRESELSVVRAKQALEDLADLPLERYPHEPFISRIWELRNNLTAYDAAYVALAEALGAPLLTLDIRLVRSRGHRATVEEV